MLLDILTPAITLSREQATVALLAFIGVLLVMPFLGSRR